jgi:glycosyltransferase involved in cell wall biosynthesis
MNLNKMKIVHTTISSCENERRIFNQAKTALKNGYRVEIFALQLPDLPLKMRLNEIILRRISIGSLSKGPLKFIIFNLKLLGLLIRADFNILHAHDLWVLPATALASMIKNCALIYDSHEFASGLEIFSKKPVSGMIWALVEKIFIKRNGAIIAINNYHKGLFLDRYKNIPEPVVIMNFPFRYENSKTEHLPEFAERHDKILYQGILKNHRGLPQVIEASAELLSGTLEIIGYGDIENDLYQLVKKLKLEQKVIFRGKFEWSRLLDATKMAKAGLALFEPEGINYKFASPNKFFEYIMAGTPVIASNIPSFRDFISNYEVGILVSVNDETQIAQAMNKLIQDEEYWNKLHNNCLAAREKWNWEAQEGQFLSIYQNCLNIN